MFSHQIALLYYCLDTLFSVLLENVCSIVSLVNRIYLFIYLFSFRMLSICSVLVCRSTVYNADVK